MIAMLQMLYQAVLDVKLEIGVFILAASVHFLIFSDHGPRKVGPVSKQGKKGEPKEARGQNEPSQRGVDKSNSPGSALLRALKPMLRAGAKQEALAAEMQRVLSSLGVSGVARDAALASALEVLGKAAADAGLLAAVRACLQDSTPSTKLAEQLLRSYMALLARAQFDELLAAVESECNASGVPLPQGVAALALQSSLGANDLESALARLPDVAVGLKEQQTVQLKPRDQQLLQQFVRLADQQDSMPALLDALVSNGLCTAPVLEPVFLEVAQHKDSKLIQEVQRLASDRKLVLTPASRCACLVADSCSDEELLQRYESSLADVDVLTVHTLAGCTVAKAAIRLERKDALARLLKDCEDSRRVGLLKSFGNDGHLSFARQVFEACPVKASCLHNALLDATVKAGDIEELNMVMAEAQKAGMADVVTFNTAIKGHVQKGDAKSARKMLDTMQAAGLKPNVVTFNELVDAMVASNSRVDWALIDEMRSCGLRPNKVTCSILLKSLTPSSTARAVQRTMATLREMEDEMDEVLLSSVCEACIRTSSSNILVQELRRQKGPKAVNVQGSHTYGSLIRAHGFINDLEGVWSTWRQMRDRQVQLTSVTLGCMVEALVNNDEIEAGHDLIQQVAADAQTKPLVNSVTYGSILKGFCRQKRFSRVWKVYEEMLAERMQFSAVTYNSLIDACARSGEMNRVQPLLEDMAKQGIAPNVITYSTVLKGHCAANRLSEAFKLLEDMKKDSELRPDEVTYNTLLDGCARYGLFDKGLAVLADMRAAGVAPSNYTLSVLVKLATRAKRPMQAFELCDNMAQEYNLRLNVHVYNNLIQACIAHSTDLSNALGTLARMLAEKVHPDQRTYTLLLRACISSRSASDCARLLRSAAGLGAKGAALRGGAAALSQELLTEVLDFLLCSQEQGATAVILELASQPGLEICQRYASKAMRLK